MAPPSKSNHPVAVVRKYTGKTQQSFAEIAGIAAITIRMIESGSKELSPENADRIAVAVGVDPASLLDKESAYPRELGSRVEYSAESFNNWITSFQNDHSDDHSRIIEYAEVFKEEIETLLIASVTLKHRKFRPVVLALCRAISEIGVKFQLTSAIDSVRKGHAGPDLAPYETEKENAFLRRVLGKTEFAGETDLPEKTVGMTFLDLGQVPAFQAKTARWQRTQILKELRRLSRLPRPVAKRK